MSNPTSEHKTDHTLTPIDQRTIRFYDDEITAVLVEVEGKQQTYIPLRPIVEAMGMDWSAQFRRVNRDLILSEVSMSVAVTATDIEPGSRQPKTSELLALPVGFINGFLFGINASRVKEEVRSRLLRYQRECYEILANAFLNRAPRTNATLVQVRELGLAIVQMAEEQMEFDRRLEQAEGKWSDTAVAVEQLTERVGDLEERTQPNTAVTDEQASQVSQAVKAVAIELGKQSGRNEFGGVYGELYRRFGITSYKLLPAGKFEEAMELAE